MLCEVIAYILSRQRLSAKTFVTGCVFYALQDRLSLWMLCDTSGVGKLSASLSHGFSLRASPAVTHGVSPLGTVSAGWEVSLFSPSPLLHFSTSPLLHFSTGSPFGHHPRLRIVCPLRGQWVRTGRLLFSLPLHFSTGSPFGHHPRLRMVCPLRGQWMDNELFLLLPRKIKLWGGVCFLLVAALFVALKNTIRASADAIRM